MSSTLILYSSTDGHTVKICHRLKQVIEQYDHQVSLASVEDSRQFDLQSFDQIVLGASIRYGKHSQRVFDFIDGNLSLLQGKSSAFFSVNIVARKPDKNSPETNPYLRKFLRQIAWHPNKVAVFAGKLDYPRYRLIDRWMIRLIMLMTNGPTDPKAVIEFTDWHQVDEFGQELGRPSSQRISNAS